MGYKMISILDYVASVRKKYGSEIFESGQCHTLALAMSKIFNGKLIAIIHIDENKIYSYSHLVCEVFDSCYDINGNQADENWCDRWDSFHDFDFIDVCPFELEIFLSSWGAKVDNDLLAGLLSDGMLKI